MKRTISGPTPGFAARAMATKLSNIETPLMDALIRAANPVVCWACGDPIRQTEYGWGHALLKPCNHHASPTKPIRRQRKAKETNHG